MLWIIVVLPATGEGNGGGLDRSVQCVNWSYDCYNAAYRRWVLCCNSLHQNPQRIRQTRSRNSYHRRWARHQNSPVRFVDHWAMLQKLSSFEKPFASDFQVFYKPLKYDLLPRRRSALLANSNAHARSPHGSISR